MKNKFESVNVLMCRDVLCFLVLKQEYASCSS